MSSWLKLSPHHHSGRALGHEHTSYAPLGVLLLAVGLILSVYTAYAATPYTGPEAGSIGLHGVVPGKPPTTAATIKSPANGQHFSATPITVSGTCPPNTLVEIFKNDIFAGSTACSNAGTYTVEVDLLIGANILIARVYDALNQPGPDSNAITVFYDALPLQAGALAALDFGGPQMLLNTDAAFRGSFPDQDMPAPLTIIGGRPPFAVNIQWGDSSNNLVPRNDNVTFTTTHKYKKPGVYQISFQATDADGRVAFLTVPAIINGQPDLAPTVEGSTTKVNPLVALWPLYVALVAVVISFWLGERREKHVLAKHHQLVTS